MIALEEQLRRLEEDVAKAEKTGEYLECDLAEGFDRAFHDVEQLRIKLIEFKTRLNRVNRRYLRLPHSR